jgi:hypothetical protein
MRWKEHAALRDKTNAKDSDSEEDSLVNPRRVSCGNPCLMEYCEQSSASSWDREGRKMPPEIYEDKVNDVRCGPKSW